MEHLPNSNTIQKIFSIKIIANEQTLAHINQKFIEDAISNELADSYLALDNWEIEEVIDQKEKTFKKTEQSVGKSWEEELTDCCFLSDPRKWKEELNYLYEIFDIEDLARWIGLREGFIQSWYDNQFEPAELYKERIHELFIKTIKDNL